MHRVPGMLRLWFSLRVPVGPRIYLVSGLALMVVKYLVDATVMRLGANVFWSPIDYLNPAGRLPRDPRDLGAARGCAQAAAS